MTDKVREDRNYLIKSEQSKMVGCFMLGRAFRATFPGLGADTNVFAVLRVATSRYAVTGPGSHNAE